MCVENANRSQMAEAFARMLGGGAVEAYRASSRPSGAVNPKAVESMRELGYDLTAHRSKSLADLPDEEFDLVATMGCGDACPLVRARRRADWDIPDAKHLSLNALADRAQKGDAAALPEIRRVLDEHPEVWKTAGDWAVHARESWVTLASGGDAVIAESTRRQLDARQEELGRPFQEPLERLLVERLVICHFQLQLADAELAAAEKRPAAERGDVLKCHAAAQRAFQQAQTALTRHRQLTKTGPSPIDMLRPVGERSPVGYESDSQFRKSVVGGSVG